MTEYLLAGFSLALRPDNLFYCFIGCVWGTVVGIWVQLGEERCRHSFWEPRQCSEVFT